MEYHFEDDAVLKAIEGTNYLRENVRSALRQMTSGEKWSLYRAIVSLAEAAAPELDSAQPEALP